MFSEDSPARIPRAHPCTVARARVSLLGLFLVLSTLVPGCGEPRRAADSSRSRTDSRVDLFVRALGAATQRDEILFTLAGVELRDANGSRVSLDVERPELSSAGLERRRLMAGGNVEASSYEAIILRVSTAFLQSGDQRIPLRLLPNEGVDGTVPESPSSGDATTENDTRLAPEIAFPEIVEYEIKVPVEVRRHEAVAVFLDWDVTVSLSEGEGFRPSLGARLERAQVRLGLLYVADRASDSVVALDRSSGDVVATGKVGRSPEAVAIARDRRRLFAANGGDGSVSIYDTVQNLAISTIPIQLDARCTDISIIEDLGLAVVANSALDTVSFLDVRQAARLGDVRVGRRPVRMIVVPRSRRLFVANKESDSVSVIDTATRGVVATLTVEARPTDIVTDRRGREIYVGHELSPNLLVFDAVRLAPVDSIRVGDQVTALLVDRRRDRIYVARSQPAEIVEVDRGLSAVVRRIRISSPVTALAQPPDGPLIYGTSPQLGGLVVVNVTLGREQTVLACGAVPVDVVTYD